MCRHHERWLAGLLGALVLSGVASPRAQPAARVAVCPLVSKAEVKTHLPWQAMFDAMPLEELPIGATGSSCGFPNLHVQVMPYTPRFFEELRKTGPLEAVPALGDAAFFRDNKGEYAEVFVQVGTRLLTLQADVNTTVAAIRPNVLALAKLYVTRLR